MRPVIPKIFIDRYENTIHYTFVFKWLWSTVRRYHPYSLLVTFLICSSIINLLLVSEITSLRNTLGVVKSEGRLAIGSYVKAFSAKAMDENPTTINYSDMGVPTILYIFTPKCSWCLRNIQNIKATAQQTTGRFRLIGVSLSSENLKEYILQHDLTIPIFAEPSDETKTNYKLGGTPQTFIISPEGRVVKIWSGAYMGNLKSEIDNYLQVKLPGLND